MSVDETNRWVVSAVSPSALHTVFALARCLLLWWLF